MDASKRVEDANVLREPDIAYHVHFDTEKGCLSMDNEGVKKKTIQLFKQLNN